MPSPERSTKGASPKSCSKGENRDEDVIVDVTRIGLCIRHICIHAADIIGNAFGGRTTRPSLSCFISSAVQSLL